MKLRLTSLMLRIGFIIPVMSSVQIKLPTIIRNTLILQRDAKLNICGWASAGEQITLTFNKKKLITPADLS